MNRGHCILASALVLAWALASGQAIGVTGRYVGSKACQDCHAEQYESFMKYAKKAHSYGSIEIMASDLTPEEVRECYACHTTGYGKPGGFKSREETPELANTSCEVCHGPGADHIEAGGDKTLVKGKPSIKDCESCHSAERVASFNYKPLLFGGAH